MMQYLQLTRSSPRDIEPTDFLGPWCVEGRGKVLLEELSNSSVKDVFIQRDELYDQVLSTLADWLNEIHGVNKAKTYWEVILYRFLGLYINELFPRYLFLKEALSLDEKIAPIVLDPSEYKYFASDKDLRNEYDLSDKANLQFFSQIARVVCDSETVRKCYTSEFKFVEIANSDTQQISKTVMQKIQSIVPRNINELFSLYRALRSRLHKSITANDIVYYPAHFSKSSLNAIERSGIFRFRSIQLKSQNLHIKVNPDVRSTLKAPLKASEIERSIISSLQHNLPMDYVEHYKSHKKIIDESITKFGTPKYILAGFVSYVKDRIWIAECKEKNSRLVVVQHGSAYGESIKMPWQKGEMRMSDIFVSWGWSGRKTVPLPAPRLMDLSIDDRKPSKLLFVLRMNYRYPKLDYSLSFSNNIPQSEFLASLSPEIRSMTTARIRLDKLAAESEQSKWHVDYPEVKIDRGDEPIISQFADAKLVVVDYLFSTTFAECIKLGIPVIVFAEDQEEIIHPEAREIYKVLQKVGIVHFDPVSAATTVNDAYSSINDWWYEPERQEAILNYAKLYALATEDAVERWSSFFKGNFS